jgi:hypothetical protein
VQEKLKTEIPDQFPRRSAPLDVHSPHGSIHSVKDFMLHLLAITAGLLIALGLEASVERIHHSHLVREARENISQEIRSNQQAVDLELNALPAEKKQFETILSTISDVQCGRASKPIGNFGWTLTRLSDSAWSTASSTGALGLMNYGEAQRYSQLYATQQIFNSTMEARGEMYAFLERMSAPDKPSNAEFEAGKRTITFEIILAQFLNEIGGKLKSSYGAFSPQDR